MNNERVSTTAALLAIPLLVAIGSQAWAQQIPANSADSGRRAIISINQTQIYSNINHANSTALDAWNSSINAYNLGADAWNRANTAQATADAANAKGGGFATQMFTAYDGGDMISQVACIYGSYGPASGMVPVHQPTGWSFQPYSCPPGSTTYVFSRGTLPPASDTGGDGGGGGGGGSGGG